MSPAAVRGTGETPLAFLWESFRALLPTLSVDVLGTIVVYYVLLPHFSASSIWPILGASLVPIASNIANFARRRSVDIIGLIILLGMIVGLIPAAFGGTQRMLLIRESFLTGLIGVVLLVSPFVMRQPIFYYVFREFLTANDKLPEGHFEVLWRAAYFRRGVRVVTIVWGAVMLGDFVMRAFIALRMSVGFALGVAPVLTTILLLILGVATAIWLGHETSRVLNRKR
ncbi:MAG: VC0807 family protein [Candidatus Tyrphobacter sp.]